MDRTGSLGGCVLRVVWHFSLSVISFQCDWNKIVILE